MFFLRDSDFKKKRKKKKNARRTFVLSKITFPKDKKH